MLKQKGFLALFTVLLAFPLLVFGQQKTNQGERLYQLKCGRCHFSYPPQKYTFEEWKTVVKEMGPLAGLDRDTEVIIMDYLEQQASAKEPSGLPTSPVLAGYVYTEFFSGKDIVDTFDIHYLNLAISGRLHERVSYHTEFEVEHGGAEKNPPFIEQAYIDVWLRRGTALRVGAILTPYNRFDDFHGPLENLMVTRPQISREIGASAWKEVGVDLHGNVFWHQNFYLNYDLYVINGLGSGSRLRNSRQYLDNNDAKSLGFRVSGVVKDRWEFGASYYRGAWDNDGDLGLSLYGFHFLGKAGDLNLFAEYSQASSENPGPLAKGKAKGYFVQASYLAKGKLRTSIRYGTLDYLDKGNLLGRKPTNMDNKALALGFNFYLTPTIVFKVEYNFVIEGDRETKKDNDLLSLQAAIRF